MPPRPSLLRRVSFRARLSTLSAAAVGLAIALSAVASYLFVSHQLYQQVDTSLGRDGDNITQLSPRPNLDGTVDFNYGAAAHLAARSEDVLQLITPSGAVIYPTPPLIRVGRADRAVASRAANDTDPSPDGVIHDLYSGGTHYRVYTVGVPYTHDGAGLALQLAHPLNETDHTLGVLKVVLIVVAVSGVALAVLLGYLIAQATIRPVVRLTRAAEHVAVTQDLDATIDEDGNDELSRLAHAFNGMLGALGASRQQQAQLISDAGHELRTPLTSLRTNIEVLMRVQDLPSSEREELLGDVKAQLEELTTLIGDVVELARQDERQPEPEEVRLDHIVTRAVDRAQRRAPGLRFDLELTPGSVQAQPALLERAVLNVLDNATKWSPPGASVKVALTRPERWCLDVRDHGPGIADGDLPRVFDRFYRAPSARAMPGSGLGLAIVRQVVTAHGGTVAISSPADGGTLVHIELPTVAETEASPPSGALGAWGPSAPPDQSPAVPVGPPKR